MKGKVPIIKLTKPERLWLTEVYGLLTENIKFDYKDVWGRLNGRIKEDFRPASMNHRLISASGEQLRLLGVVAIDRNYKILTKCNKIINTIKNIIIANPKMESFDVSLISEKSSITHIEVGIILSLINDYGRFWRGATYDINNSGIKSIQISSEENIYYQYKNFKGIKYAILESINQEKSDKAFFLNSPQENKLSSSPSMQSRGNNLFINPKRIFEIKSLQDTRFDFRKLIKLCEEINDNYSRGNFLSVSMIGRTILNHIPPIFDLNTFDELANNYGKPTENKSFKRSMQNLNQSLKPIADSHLHLKIRKSEILPNETQVDFRQDLDVLLAELVRVTK